MVWGIIMLSFKQYLNEFLIPQEMMAAAAKGAADANREIKKKKAFDASEKGFEVADKLKRKSYIVQTTARGYKQGTGLENPGRERETKGVINRFIDSGETGIRFALRTAEQERIADVERAARAPIVTKKPKPSVTTEKPKKETPEERKNRIASMSKDERLELIKQLNKPQESAESLIDRSNREMSDYEIAHRRSGTPHLRPRGF